MATVRHVERAEEKLLWKSQSTAQNPKNDVFLAPQMTNADHSLANPCGKPSLCSEMFRHTPMVAFC
jgi:hypothetical protein